MTTPAVPADAITAAVQANDDFYDNDDDLKFSWQDGADVRELTRRMLEAAAPVIAAQARRDEREACAELAEQVGATWICYSHVETVNGVDRLGEAHPFADLLRGQDPADWSEHTQLQKPPPNSGPVERLGTTPVDDPWATGPAGLLPLDDPEDRPGTSSAAQIREMHALFGQLGVTDRGKQLELTRSVLKIDMLASSKQLSYRQAGDLLLALRDQAKARTDA